MESENEFTERLQKYFDENFKRTQAGLCGTEAEIVVFRATALKWYLIGAAEARLALMRTIQDQHARLMREIDPAGVR